jgi:putative inorganic carbon (HCO3(-)) transporter
MLQSVNVVKLYSLSIAFILLTTFVAFSYPDYLFVAIPLILLAIVVFLVSIEWVFLLVAFCTPFSLKIDFGGSGINVPSEPLMLVFLVLFIIKILQDYQKQKEFLKQGLTLIIIIQLGWIFFTSVTSILPIVSFKFLLARTWAVVFGYFWGAIFFKNPKKIKQFFLAFGLGLGLVVVYTTINHYHEGFSQKRAMLVMKPFMDDHTVYSAVCAIVLCFITTILLSKAAIANFFTRVFFIGIALLSLIGVALSYSRAAALSVLVALGFYALTRFKIRFKTMMVVMFIGLSVALFYQNEIYQKVRLNNSASGKTLAGDLKSISNIKNDESNVERLNRWEAGYRMFIEKPFFGFGPGTYMFKYSAYQRAHEMTSISTTQGDMGNMHSEYFGPLVDSGIIGFIITLILFGYTVAILLKLHYTTKNKETKVLSLAILLALISYYFHGLMNNFLDQDKVAVIFWAMLGMISALIMREKSVEVLE